MKISGSFFTSLACFAVCISIGCVSPARNATLLDVPFIPQEQKNHCGVVSLAMALTYYGVPYSMDSLVAEAFVPYLGGSSLQLLAATATRYGLSVTREDADATSLGNMLARGDLPILYLAPISNTEQTGHFALVTGISDNSRRVRIHGRTRAHRWITLRRLQRHATGGVFPSLSLGRDSTPPKTRDVGISVQTKSGASL